MSYVTLPQSGRRIRVGESQTIPQAALDTGIAYPHSCRSGRCGACKSRLIAGHVELGRHSPFALGEDERAAGLILACRALPSDDVVVVEWLDETFMAAPPITQDATVTSVDGMTHDILSIHLELADREAFRFAAGQYLTVTIPDAPPRDYSMASRPDQKLVELHVRAVPGGHTSNRIHASLKPGDQIRVCGPTGSAYLREAHSGPIIAVAGGSGLAPIKSIIETALLIGMRQPIHFYFGARTERDLYLVDHFRALERSFPNFAFVPVLSQDAANQRFRGGYVSDAIAEHDGDLSGAKAYVAGPPAMVDATQASLVMRGMPAADMHADVFFTPEQGDNKVA